MVNEAEVKVKSLQKALEILNCFTKKSSWGVTEISADLVGTPGMAGSIFEREAQGGVAGQPAADFSFAPALFRIAQQQPAQKLALRLIG